MELPGSQHSDLLFVNFNQDFGCFACGTNSGFRIYNVDPFRETFRRVFPNGGIGIVEMLFRCNLLALVGGGRNPRYPPNKVMIWDDFQKRCVGELSFRHEVRAVRLRRDRVAVALPTKVYVYRFSDLKLLTQFDTYNNPRGLLALSPDASNMVLACPGPKKGHVTVELFDIQRTRLIHAHDSELAALALSLDGTHLATSSDKGTLIRVFDTQSCDQLQELRRGMDRADIRSLAFNQTCTYLACSSDKGTVHIFALKQQAKSSEETKQAPEETQEQPKKDKENKKKVKNAKSGFSLLGAVIPGTSGYFGSEWSYAQVRGVNSASICAFGSMPNTLAIVSADGTFRMVSFEQGGECSPIFTSPYMGQGEILDEEEDNANVATADEPENDVQDQDVNQDNGS